MDQRVAQAGTACPRRGLTPLGEQEDTPLRPHRRSWAGGEKCRGAAPVVDVGGATRREVLLYKGQGMKHRDGRAQMQEHMGRNHAGMAEIHTRMHGASGTAEKKEGEHKH